MNKIVLTIRGSGRNPGKCYLDLNGSYALSEIAEAIHAGRSELEQIVGKNDAAFDSDIGVWYFPDRDRALAALQEIEGRFCATEAGRSVYLTNEEIEYIRQALINEGSNVISVRNELKHRIFEKFNR